MIWVETALGRVPVWGSFESRRPVIFAIRGAFPARDYLEDLAPDGADLALVHLPGFHSPMLKATSIGAFARAFDDVVRTLFQDREVTALGASTGALVALGMRPRGRSYSWSHSSRPPS